MAEVDGPEARNPFSGPRADLGRRARAVDTIIIGVAVVAGLYFGRLGVLHDTLETDRRCPAWRVA